MSDSMNLTTSRSDEEWVTKKKVEITTTKNIETKVYRQLVLEDGTVIDEEVPTVTVDKTEDKQVFVTDHDEEREIKDPLANQAVTSAFPVNRGTHIGDKFTSVKTTKDVTENIRKTEAVQNIGNIRAREVKDALADKKNLGKYLKQPNADDHEVMSSAKTVFNSKTHSTISNKEDVKERKWISGGKVKTERIVTQEHLEYDSDDSSCSNDSKESDMSSWEILEPEEYKTRTEESYTEYFVNGKGSEQSKMIKVAEGPRYKSETSVGKKETGQFPVHKQLTQVRSWDNDRGKSRKENSRQQVFSSSLDDLTDFRRQEKNAVHKNEKRDVEEKVYLAKVIDETTPVVKMREKKNNISYHASNGDETLAPVRPPRAKEYTFRNCRLPNRQWDHLKPTRPHSLDLSEHFYFGESAPAVQNFKQNQLLSQELRRNYHSSQDLSRDYQSGQNSHRSHHETQFQNFSRSNMNERNFHSTQNLSERSKYSKTVKRPRSVNFSLEEPIRVKSNYKLFPTKQPEKHHQSTSSIYKAVASDSKSQNPKESKSRDISEWRVFSEKLKSKERKSSGQLIFSSETPRQGSVTEEIIYKSSEKILPSVNNTRLIPIEIYSNSAPVTPLGSPSTKYRTRVVVNGAA